MLPKALKAKHDVNMKIKMDKYLVLNKSIKEVSDYIETCKYIKQQEILEKLILSDKIKIDTIKKKKVSKNNL